MSRNARVSFEIRRKSTGDTKRVVLILDDLPRRPADRDQAIADAMARQVPRGWLATDRLLAITEVD